MGRLRGGAVEYRQSPVTEVGDVDSVGSRVYGNGLRRVPNRNGSLQSE